MSLLLIVHIHYIVITLSLLLIQCRMAPEVAAVEKKGGYNNLVSFHWLLACCYQLLLCCHGDINSVTYGQ